MQKQSDSTREVYAYSKTSKGNQTVVPVEIRKALGYMGKLRLIWEYSPATKEIIITAKPLDIVEWRDATLGKYSTGRDSDQIIKDLDKMRSEWD